MKKFNLLGVVCGCFFLLISTSVNAALVTPAGLNPGDKYHVIFVTSNATGPMSSNIADYDAFVQSAADAAGIGSTLSLSWRVVGSTTTIDAKDHIQPLFPGSTRNTQGSDSMILQAWETVYIQTIYLQKADPYIAPCFTLNN